MKNISNKISFWNLFIGIVIGIGVGVYLLNAFVPNANQLINMYHWGGQKGQMSDATTTATVAGNTQTVTNTTTVYVAPKITSEKQFVQQMLAHQQAAIIMAQQALALNPGMTAESRDLAKDIISTQSTEVKIMKDWLAAWKK